MKKYFSKEETKMILTLLYSKDKENIKFGLDLIKTHPKYKNFKKLITYRNKVWNPGKSFQGCKVNCDTEIMILNNYLLYGIVNSFRPYDYLINFVKKRTKK